MTHFFYEISNLALLVFFNNPVVFSFRYFATSFFLEFAVALIQTFGFTVLLCIYINGSLNISH